MKHNPIRITASFIRTVPAPTVAYVIYRDETLKGFGLPATGGGIKTFVAEKRLGGKVRRVKIGRYPELTAEQARKQAQSLLGKIALVNDPISERKERKSSLETLCSVYEEYKTVRQLKPSTTRDYDAAIDQAFFKWRDKPISVITPSMVVDRYHELSKSGKTTASRHMRCLRAVFNFALVNYVDADGAPLLTNNPVSRLTALKAWHRSSRRRSYIRNYELKPWFLAVNDLDGVDSTSDYAGVAKDYMLFILFTGLCRSEAASLRWSNISMESAEFSIEGTKNHCEHSLPLSDYLLDILSRRSSARVNEFVFPGKGPSDCQAAPHQPTHCYAVASALRT